MSGYIGDGCNAWSAVRRSDTARLIRLGIESAPAGTRLHAVAEEFIPTHVIAEAIGQVLGIPVTSVAPEDAEGHFGFVSHFFGQSLTGSSEITRSTIGRTPAGQTLIEDILGGAYTRGRRLMRPPWLWPAW